MGTYDVIVVGAGHAGCEAGLAAARMGCRTLMLSINLEAVAMMACNPSIGGTGKGHLVREIDALGGEMGINIDKTFIQSRMLNTAKGPAVHSLRAQADKNQYHIEMKKTLEREENLDLKKAARAVGEKSVAMLPQKELLGLTGYVHGGCSPVGMKKQFPTVFHETAESLPQVAVSAGKIGYQVVCDPKDLMALLRAGTADLTVE